MAEQTGFFQKVIDERDGGNAFGRMIGIKTVEVREGYCRMEMEIMPELLNPIGSIHGGETYNIIPDEVKLQGCMRATDEGTRQRLKNRVTEIVEGVCAAMRAHGSIRFFDGYLPTVNEEACTNLAYEKAKALFGADSVEWMEQPIMVSEDVSEYLAQVPGCFWLYATPGGSCRHHSSTFDLDESLLWRGSVLLAETAKAYLSEGV